MGISESVALISNRIYNKNEYQRGSDIRYVTANGNRVRLDGRNPRDKADLAAEIVHRAFSDPEFKGPVIVTVVGKKDGSDHEYTIEFARAGNGQLSAKPGKGTLIKK